MTVFLKNKVALVTGAARGTGQAIALALARAGACVAVADVNPDGVQRTADETSAAGGTASAHVLDVGSKMAVQWKTCVVRKPADWGCFPICCSPAKSLLRPVRPRQ